MKVYQKCRNSANLPKVSGNAKVREADRVAMMTYRPGTIKRDVRIAMPRPRDSASAEFNALKKELAKLVMEEQMRYTETEIKSYTAD